MNQHRVTIKNYGAILIYRKELIPCHMKMMVMTQKVLFLSMFSYERKNAEIITIFLFIQKIIARWCEAIVYRAGRPLTVLMGVVVARGFSKQP